jgi:hypothetical protein
MPKRKMVKPGTGSRVGSGNGNGLLKSGKKTKRAEVGGALRRSFKSEAAVAAKDKKTKR